MLADAADVSHGAGVLKGEPFLRRGAQVADADLRGARAGEDDIGGVGGEEVEGEDVGVCCWG